MLLSFVCMSCTGRIREEQRRELTAIYPEMGKVLQDNFSYYQGQIVRFAWMAVAAVLFLLFVFGGILVRLKRREDKSVLVRLDDEINVVYEQLVRFQKGNFESMLLADDAETSDKWKGIYEKLRELAQSPDLSDDERRDFLETEAQEIRKMEALLGELVKLSRLENNMIQIQPERSSLKQTISEAVAQIYMKAHAKHIEICAEIEEDVEILHDRKWTVEAFANILENAVKYSEPMTKIDIRVSHLPSNLLVEIEDEGIGIPEEELHEIFQRFYRGSNAKEMAKEGAGVGLYLARSIIEQQGGTIIAKRKPACGTIFKIMLPI